MPAAPATSRRLGVTKKAQVHCRHECQSAESRPRSLAVAARRRCGAVVAPSSLILAPPYPPPPFASNATWLLPLHPYRQDFDGNPSPFSYSKLAMYVPGSLYDIENLMSVK